MYPEGVQITALLQRWSAGDRAAMDEAAPALSAELRRIAAARLRADRSVHTLQPTALVNEAYLKLLRGTGYSFESRGHFFALASHLMRQILTDYARKYRAARRNGERLPLDQNAFNLPARADEMLALDEALEQLARCDERKARAVEMRYFGGMNGDEIAAVLGVATATVSRDLRMARAWLEHYLAAGARPASE